MNKNKEILRYARKGIILYGIPCFFGAYTSSFQGADLYFTAKIAGVVMLFITVGTIVALVKKEYDCRKHIGYVYLLSSIGLLLQVVFQGSILGEKREISCIISYVIFFVIGIFILLFAMKEIIKDEFMEKLGKVVGFVIGLLFIFMIQMGKEYLRHGGETVSDEIMQAEWFIVLILSCIYGMISSINLTSVTRKE